MQQLSNSVCYWNPKDVSSFFCGVPLPLALVTHEFTDFPTTHMYFSHQSSFWKDFCGRQKLQMSFSSFSGLTESELFFYDS